MLYMAIAQILHLNKTILSLEHFLDLLFSQYWWNPCHFEVNDGTSVGLIRSVGCQVSTEYMGFLQTVSASAFETEIKCFGCSFFLFHSCESMQYGSRLWWL